MIERFYNNKSPSQNTNKKPNNRIYLSIHLSYKLKEYNNFLNSAQHRYYPSETLASGARSEALPLAAIKTKKVFAHSGMKWRDKNELGGGGTTSADKNPNVHNVIWHAAKVKEMIL